MSEVGQWIMQKLFFPIQINIKVYKDLPHQGQDLHIYLIGGKKSRGKFYSPWKDVIFLRNKISNLVAFWGNQWSAWTPEWPFFSGREKVKWDACVSVSWIFLYVNSWIQICAWTWNTYWYMFHLFIIILYDKLNWKV